MILYSYRCPQGHWSEHFFRMGTAPPAVPCPTCGGDALRQYRSLPVIIRPEGWSLHPEDPQYWTTLRDREDRPQWQR